MAEGPENEAQFARGGEEGRRKGERRLSYATAVEKKKRRSPGDRRTTKRVGGEGGENRERVAYGQPRTETKDLEGEKDRQ